MAVLVAVGGVVAVQLTKQETYAVAWTNGVVEDEQFNLEVPHRRVSLDGESYYFTTDLSWEQLIPELAEQHPAGALQPDGTWLLRNSRSPVLIERAADVDDADFVITSQVAFLSDGDAASAEIVSRIPFPVSAAGAWSLEFGVAVPVEISFAELSGFYEGFTGVEFGDDWVSVPTSEQGVVRLEYDDGAVTAVAN